MAIWSDIWTNKTNKFARRVALYNARFVPQAPAKSKAGGQYPHEQAFRRPVRSKIEGGRVVQK